jgi:hypothetical protein
MKGVRGMVNCDIFKKRLNEFHEGNIPEGLKHDMEEHMLVCSDCNRLYEGEKAADKALQGAFSKMDMKFDSSRENILKNTGLSLYQQRKAEEKLKNLNIINVQKKGMPSKNWYYINLKVLLNFISNSTDNSKPLHNHITLNNKTSENFNDNSEDIFIEDIKNIDESYIKNNITCDELTEQHVIQDVETNNNNNNNNNNNIKNNTLELEEKSPEEWDRDLRKRFIKGVYKPQDILILADNYLWKIPKEARIYILEKYGHFYPEYWNRYKDTKGNYVDNREDSTYPVDEELPF